VYVTENDLRKVAGLRSLNLTHASSLWQFEAAWPTTSRYPISGGDATRKYGGRARECPFDERDSSLLEAREAASRDTSLSCIETVVRNFDGQRFFRRNYNGQGVNDKLARSHPDLVRQREIRIRQTSRNLSNSA
jgi:hypothetical protein